MEAVNGANGGLHNVFRCRHEIAAFPIDGLTCSVEDLGAPFEGFVRRANLAALCSAR